MIHPRPLRISAVYFLQKVSRGVLYLGSHLLRSAIISPQARPTGSRPAERPRDGQ